MKDSWEKVTLSDFIDLKHGYQFRDTDFTENGIPIIKIGNVWERGLDLENVSFISKNRYEVFKQYEIKNGDILMSLTGNIGRVLEVKGLNETVLQNYRVGNFYSKDESVLEKHFIKWILGSKTLLKQLEQYSNQSAQANFGKQDLDKLKFYLPPIPQQRKIAEILSTVDAVLEKTEAAIAKYQQLKQGLMHDVFTRGIDAHTGQLRPKQTQAPELYKQSPLGWIPKEWEVEELGNLGEFKNGVNKDKASFGYGTPFVNIGDAYPEKLDITKLSKVNVTNLEKSIYKLEKGDIVFVRSSVKPSGVGYTTLFEEADETIIYCGFMIRYRFEDKIKFNPNFYNNYFRFDKFRRNLLAVSTVSANTNINQESLNKLLCVCPSIKEQKLINIGLNKIIDKIHTEQQALAKYQQLKAGLLQGLLTGRVEVSVNN